MKIAYSSGLSLCVYWRRLAITAPCYHSLWSDLVLTNNSININNSQLIDIYMCVSSVYGIKKISVAHTVPTQHTKMRTEHVCHYYYHLCVYDFLCVSLIQRAASCSASFSLSHSRPYFFIFISIFYGIWLSFFSYFFCRSWCVGPIRWLFFYYCFFDFFTNFSNVKKANFYDFRFSSFFCQFSSSLMHMLKLLHSTADNFNHAQVKWHVFALAHERRVKAWDREIERERIWRKR